MFNPVRSTAAFALACGLALCSSAALAQSTDIQTTYSLRKGTCNNGAGMLVTISPGKIQGPGFACQLSEPVPAGTGLEAYTAACTVDDANITDTMAFDLGNYADHFEVTVPGREGWMSLYPCTKVPGLE